jgi:kelch-like protein 10
VGSLWCPTETVSTLLEVNLPKSLSTFFLPFPNFICVHTHTGFNGFNRLNTAERYDPEDPSPWAMIPDMSSSRSNFAAVCADELLICIGGFNGNQLKINKKNHFYLILFLGATTIPYVECYDSKVNEWFDASHMNLNRSALSACVVPNLPNAREYSYLHRISELLGIPS